jgi:phosphatidylserine decarboxylase precursor-related protein
MTLARESHPYLLVGLAVAAAGALLGFAYLSVGALLLSGFVAYFFRDPAREIPSEPGLVVSPGDGRVVEIKTLSERGQIRVSIFLSLFDVHINRAPVAGVVRSVHYQPGRFLPANMARAALENERNDLTIECDIGSVCLSQIAGVVARRIVCWKKVGDAVSAGERIGLIQFGSRLEVVLPPGVKVEVVEGSKVKGGSSVLARIPAGFPRKEELEFAQAHAR